MENFDVVVVGGSIGGSTAGYLLGRAGRSVAIVEPRLFPHHRACGEGLSSLGVSLLRRADLWSTELERLATPFHGYKLHLSNGHTVKLNTGADDDAEGYGIERYHLDCSLQSAAEEYCRVVTARATRFKRIGRSWEIDTSAGVFSAKELVIAWGSNPKARGTEGHQEVSSKFHRYGVVFWFSGAWDSAPDRTINVFQVGSRQYLTTPVGTNTLNVSILIKGTDDRRVTKKELLEMAERCAEAVGFSVKSVLHTAGASAVHSSINRVGVPGAYCIGDALERFDPIGGMGMTSAISSAILISNVLNRKFDLNTDWVSANQRYLGLFHRQSWHFRNLTRLNFTALVRMSPDIVSLVGRFPTIGSKVFELSRDLSHRRCMAVIGQL